MLRRGDLKEAFVVGYAGGFRLLCKDRKTAEKMFAAAKQWLEERPGLEISPERFKIVNLRRRYSEFLGFELKLWRKSQKHIVKSHIAKESKEKYKKKLKQKIKVLRHDAIGARVRQSNATVLGLHGYYKIASRIGKDLAEITSHVNRGLYCGTKCIRSKRGNKSRACERFCGKYEVKPLLIRRAAPYPIHYVQTTPQVCFSQDICNYTVNGREKIRKYLQSFSYGALQCIMRNPVQNQSLEYNDNRISLCIGQCGRCFITGEKLKISDMEVYHRTMRLEGGTDAYKNLVFVTGAVYKLIHTKEVETFEKYLELLKRKSVDSVKLNNLRRLVRNCGVNEDKQILMERRVKWRFHARCGVGESPEMTSKDYLSLFDDRQGIEAQYSEGVTKKLTERSESPQHTINVTRHMLHTPSMVLDNANPAMLGRLSKNVRIAAMKTPLVDEDVGTAASIRIVNPQSMEQKDFINGGTATQPMMNFLAECPRYGISICVAGATSSGKTTLLGWLLTTIPDNERIYTIESGSRELALVRKKEGAVANSVTHTLIRDSENERQKVDQIVLLDIALRFNPDIIVVGEMCRPKADAAQETARTGVVVVTAIHPNGYEATYRHMAFLCKRAMDMSDETLLSYVIEAYPIVAFCKQLKDRERCLVEIQEYEIRPDGTRSCQPLFQYKITENRVEDGKFIVEGHHERVHAISGGLAKRLLKNEMPGETLKKLRGGASI